MDRLAQGYVRQELRPLKRSHGNDIKPLSVVLRAIKEVAAPYFSRGKKIPPDKAARTKQRILDVIQESYHPFRHRERKNILAGLDGVKSTVDEYLYWQPCQSTFQQIDINDHGEEIVREFEDDILDLRAIRFLNDRRRFVFDDIGCNVTISEHLLKRLTERRKDITEPLRYLSDHIDEWLPLAAMYRVVMVTEGLTIGIAIPLADGLMMGTMTLSGLETTSDLMRDRLRIRCDSKGLTSFPLPCENFFLIPANAEIATLRLTTFISSREMGPAKEWVQDCVTGFTTQYNEAMMPLMEFIINPESEVADDKLESLQRSFEAAKDMLDSERWQKACPVGRPAK